MKPPIKQAIFSAGLDRDKAAKPHIHANITAAPVKIESLEPLLLFVFTHYPLPKPLRGLVENALSVHKVWN